MAKPAVVLQGDGLALQDANRHILRVPMRVRFRNNCCDKAFKLRRK